MARNNNLQGVYSRLRRFTPLYISNTVHKTRLRSLLTDELKPISPAAVKPSTIHGFLLPAFAAGLAIIIFSLVFLFQAFFSHTDLARIYILEGASAMPGNHTELDKNRGTALTMGTVHKTPAAETHLIVLKNGTALRIFAGSEYKLTGLSESQTCLHASLYLERGMLEYDSHNPDSSACFSLDTVSARIQPLGTLFTAQVGQDNTLHVEVTRGTVRIIHLYGSFDLVSRAALSREEKDRLESLIDGTVILLKEGQAYSAGYGEIYEFRERIHALLELYTGSANPRDKEAVLKDIEETTLLMHEKLQKSVVSDGRNNNPTVLSGKGIQGTDRNMDTTVRPQPVPTAGAFYMMSTLEADDPYKNLWVSSGSRDFSISSAEQAFSGTSSLKIGTETPVSEIFAWQLTLTDNLPLTKKLSLKVMIKTQGLRGQGIALALRADRTTFPSDNMLLYNSTRDRYVITGTADWKEYKLALTDCIPASTKSITIYLLYLPRTTGIVYFDNVGLEFN